MPILASSTLYKTQHQLSTSHRRCRGHRFTSSRGKYSILNNKNHAILAYKWSFLWISSCGPARAPICVTILVQKHLSAIFFFYHKQQRKASGQLSCDTINHLMGRILYNFQYLFLSSLGDDDISRQYPKLQAVEWRACA